MKKKKLILVAVVALLVTSAAVELSGITYLDYWLEYYDCIKDYWACGVVEG